METYTLFELNEFIRRILALNLPEALWLRCEIAQVSESRGHYFLSLVQKGADDGRIIAQSEAILWQNAYRRLRRRIGRELDNLLQEGLAVRLQARVDFSERYGLKLMIEDIDPAFTLGQLELARRQTLEKLGQQDLLERNGRLFLPPVLQRIALLSSETAAGLQDYRQQLSQNPYGYQFRNQLFPVAVQGMQVEPEIIKQLRHVHRRRAAFDCVVIIRGGGSRLDLSAFDNYELCKAVAEFPLPVLTGIGHEVDDTVLDRIAHTSLKTPTAVADFLVERCLHFEGSLRELGRQIDRISRRRLQTAHLQVAQARQQLRHLTRQRFTDQQRMLDYIAEETPRRLRVRLRQAGRELDQLAALNNLLSPAATLQRGFTLTLRDGRPLRSAADLQPGDRLTTRFPDGAVESEVKSSSPNDKSDE